MSDRVAAETVLPSARSAATLRVRRRLDPLDAVAVAERTRAEQLAGEARKLLDNGGEASPTVLHDPRTPRHAGLTPAESVSA
jgi:hypothetical protein